GNSNVEASSTVPPAPTIHSPRRSLDRSKPIRDLQATAASQTAGGPDDPGGPAGPVGVGGPAGRGATRVAALRACIAKYTSAITASTPSHPSGASVAVSEPPNEIEVEPTVTVPPNENQARINRSNTSNSARPPTTQSSRRTLSRFTVTPS